MRKQEPSASGWLLFPSQEEKRLSHRAGDFSPQPPFARGGGPAGPGDFPPLPRAHWKEKSSVSYADSSFCERSLFSRKRSPQPPFSKGGGPTGPVDFLPLPCAHWKGKSSVSCADSSFCERSLFRARGVPSPLSQKGVARRAGGFFSFSKGGGPAGPRDFSRCPAPTGRGNPQSAALTAPFAKGAFFAQEESTAPFCKRGWPAGPGDFPLSQKGVARRAGGFFSFSKGGGPAGPGDFSPLPRAHRKGKSSVSYADSSFCERSLFHARGDRAGGFSPTAGEKKKAPTPE